MARHDRPCRNFGEFGDHECLASMRDCESEYTSLRVSVNASVNASTNEGGECGLRGEKTRIRVLLSKDRAIFQNFTHTSRVIPRRDLESSTIDERAVPTR